MKRMAILLTLLVLLTGVANALVLSNPSPTDGATLVGDGTEQFSVDTDAPAGLGTLWILNGVWTDYTMDCTSGTDCVVTPDLTTYSDLTNFLNRFVVDGFELPGFPSTNNFTIDRLPNVPTGVVATGVTETSLLVNWDDAVDVDVNEWDLERNGTIVYTGNVSEYTDGGLVTGAVYSYRVLARDSIGQVSNWTAATTGVPTDMTPPTAPIITDPSPATYTTLTPTVTINYAENVDLKVYSGTTLIANLGNAASHAWNPTFAVDGTYMFHFEASDGAGNIRTDDYTLIVDSVITTASVDIADTLHLIGADDPIVVKGTALADGGDYWIVSWNLSMYGGDFVRAIMADMVSASQNIDIDSESAPFIFCEEDYDATALDFDGSGNTYDVLNTYDETVNALTCTDTDPTGEVQYTVYMKIPVPAGLTSDTFDLSWDFGLYNTII